MNMFRKYLLKRDFWAVPRNNGKMPTCYVKHDVVIGGIYAYLQQRGVKIVVNNEAKFFTNFNELDSYLNQLQYNSNKNSSDDFIKILSRRQTSKVLRKIPL